MLTINQLSSKFQCLIANLTSLCAFSSDIGVVKRKVMLRAVVFCSPWLSPSLEARVPFEAAASARLIRSLSIVLWCLIAASKFRSHSRIAQPGAFIVSRRMWDAKTISSAKVIKNAFIQLFTRKSFIIMKLTISWRVAAAGDCIINWNDLRRIEIEHFNFFFSCQCCSLFHLIYDVANQAFDAWNKFSQRLRTIRDDPSTSNCNLKALAEKWRDRHLLRDVI